jgi:hemerythrin-like metal-binding protein
MAEKLVWKDEYSVGVELIDAQHKMFVGIVNELYEAIVTKKEKEVLDNIFKQLVAYTQFHFQTEERYFDEFQYEGADAHKAAHKDLINQVAELQQSKKDIMDDPFKLMDFLEDWLIDHIMGMDKLFGPCFNQHGLK